MSDDKVERVGDDLGEKPREVTGQPFTQDDVQKFADLLGIDDD